MGVRLLYYFADWRFSWCFLIVTVGHCCQQAMCGALCAASKSSSQSSDGQMGLSCQLAQGVELLIFLLFLFCCCLSYGFCHHCIHNTQERKCACHKGKDVDQPGSGCLS